MGEIKKDKLVLLRELISNERNVEWLSKTLNLTFLEVMGEISNLKSQGNNVSITKKNGEVYVVNFGDQSIDRNFYKLNLDSNIIRLGLISDTRFGSKYQQLSLLNEFYNSAKDLNVDTVLHLGDMSEGIYSGKKALYNDSLFLHGVQEQADYIVKSYPYVENIKTYFLTGEHDLTHINKKNNKDIGNMIADNREDMIYLGPNQCNLEINNLRFYLEHMTSKKDQPLQLSYRPQESIRTMRSEDKVDFFLQGHNLYSQTFTMRDIKCITIPSMVATTPEIRSKSIYNTVGSWFAEIELDNEGFINNIKLISSPNYKTINNDYKTAKVLRRVR